MRERAALFAAALWWGGLTALGAIAVPLLFIHAGPSVAGPLAARLFTASTWLALGCGLLLLMVSRGREGASLDWGGGALPFILGGMLLALLVEFAVAPRILARVDAAWWHRVGSGMLAAEWACAATALWRIGAAQAPPSNVGSDHR